MRNDDVRMLRLSDFETRIRNTRYDFPRKPGLLPRGECEFGTKTRGRGKECKRGPLRSNFKLEFPLD